MEYFMTNVFHALKAKKGGNYPDIPHHTTFKGFKTIPIQRLDKKKPFQGGIADGKNIWKANFFHSKIMSYKESCQLSMRAANGFFQAFQEAYINHGDLKITPDDVWSTIMIYFSKYVNDHAQELQEAFVSYKDKKELVIETDLPIEVTNQQGQKVNMWQGGDRQKYWDQFFDKVIVQISKNTTKGVVEQLGADFSTTDRFFRLLSTATIMNSFQRYFQYTRFLALCGIQNVHMGGTLDDWLHLSDKVKELAKYDVDGQMKSYIKGLKPILEQFVETYKGKPHLEFWNNVYQERQRPDENNYIPTKIRNGWIIKFFTTANELLEEVPMEIIKVPVKVINERTQQIKKMLIAGGSKGVSVEDGHVYRPHYSFAVLDFGRWSQMASWN